MVTMMVVHGRRLVWRRHWWDQAMCGIVRRGFVPRFISFARIRELRLVHWCLAGRETCPSCISYHPIFAFLFWPYHTCTCELLLGGCLFHNCDLCLTCVDVQYALRFLLLQQFFFLGHSQGLVLMWCCLDSACNMLLILVILCKHCRMAFDLHFFIFFISSSLSLPWLS